MLLLGFLAALAALALFGLLARYMVRGATRRVDEAVLLWLHAHTSPALDVLALAGAALGSGAALWAVLIAGSLFLLWRRHVPSLVLLWLSLLGGRILQGILKNTFHRPRPSLFGPEIHLLGHTFHYPTTYSFPSGHALTAVVIYGTIAYLVARLEPTRRLRRWTLGGALLLAALIGLSRLYMGVHYPSDVVAGWLVGFVWATASVLAIEVVQRVRSRRRNARGRGAVAGQEDRAADDEHRAEHGE